MPLRNMTINSSITGFVSIFRVCSQFFVLPFLARYLSPEDYGVIAIATPFIIFSALFASSGIEAPLLRNKDRDPLIWSSSFWFVSLSGLFLTFLVVAIAPIASWFFGTPQLFLILSWMSLGILLQGLSIIPIAQLRHQHRFKILSAIQMFAIFMGLASAVIVAAKGGGAWAIVTQGLVIHSLTFLLVFLASQFKPRLFFKIKLIKDHIAFGYTVMGSSFIDFTRDTLRSFIIAKVLGAALLGFYSIAVLFLYIAHRIIASVLQGVIYAYLATLKDNIELLRSMFFLLIRILTILIFPAMIMVAVAYDPVFRIVLSDKWALSGKLYMMAAPAAAFTAILSIRFTFLQIIGRVQENFRFSIEALILQISLIFIFVWQGIEWAIIGYAIAMYVFLPREIWIMGKFLECNWLDTLKRMAPTCFITFAGVFTYLMALKFIDVDALLSQMFAAIMIGLAVVLASVAVQYKSICQELDVVKYLIGSEKASF